MYSSSIRDMGLGLYRTNRPFGIICLSDTSVLVVHTAAASWMSSWAVTPVTELLPNLDYFAIQRLACSACTLQRFPRLRLRASLHGEVFSPV